MVMNTVGMPKKRVNASAWTLATVPRSSGDQGM